MNPDLRVEAIPLSHFCCVPAERCLSQNRFCENSVTYVLQTKLKEVDSRLSWLGLLTLPDLMYAEDMMPSRDVERAAYM